MSHETHFENLCVPENFRVFANLCVIAITLSITEKRRVPQRIKREI